MMPLCRTALAVVCALLGLLSPAFAQKRVALIIGNKSYLNAPIFSSANDAAMLAEALSSLGFTIIGNRPQFDLYVTSFRRAVQRFGREIQDADVALFYFSGYGVQLRGNNYLVPIDAELLRDADADFELVDISLVLRQLESASTRLNLVILDASRTNPFIAPALRSTGIGLAPVPVPPRTLISFSAQPGSVALDSGDGNSTYTRALAQAIGRPGLDIFQIFNEVGLAVASATGGKQRPWVSFSPLQGELRFAGSPANVPASTGPASKPDEAVQLWPGWAPPIKKDSNAWPPTRLGVTKPAVPEVEAQIQPKPEQPAVEPEAPRPPAPAPETEAQTQPSQPAVEPDSLKPKISDRMPQGPTQPEANALPLAYLLEEDPVDPKGRKFSGSANWRSETLTSDPNLPPEIVIRADVEVPDRMRARVTIRRNTEKALPASHTIEVMFELPADFPAGGTLSVPGILLKNSENTKGVPLKGLSNKVTDTFYLIGLSDIETDRTQNIQVLKERRWFDVPMVYKNNRRAILAIEKGAVGERVFAEVFAAWEQ